jgi:glycosyltransferase involved in cell wall biosynthesis
MDKLLPELVSVIIPSLNRPKPVSQAVKSALAQTMTALEVIVVVDGPDRATVDELKLIADPRLIVMELPKNLGPAGARNAGIEAAKGTWIAFLDDDEWLPLKIERQLEMAHQSAYFSPIVSSRFIAHTSKGDFIWPTRLPAPGDSVAEYLFIRKSLFFGEALLVTPTILAKKELFDKVRFNQNLSRHEDLDWLIRASQGSDVGIEFVPEPMAIVNVAYTKNRQSLSNTSNWKNSLNWIRSVQKLVTPQVYAGFMITVVGPMAATDSDWKAFFPLLWETIIVGRPRVFDVFLYMAMWTIPQDFRQKLRFLLVNKDKKTN